MKYRIHKTWGSWRVTYPKGFTVFNSWEEARSWVWMRIVKLYQIEDLLK